MAQPMLNKSDIQPDKKEAVVIKKYANRRLYNTETSTYVTLEDLAKMVRGDRDFVVEALAAASLLFRARGVFALLMLPSSPCGRRCGR